MAVAMRRIEGVASSVLVAAAAAVVVVAVADGAPRRRPVRSASPPALIAGATFIVDHRSSIVVAAPRWTRSSPASPTGPPAGRRHHRSSGRLVPLAAVPVSPAALGRIVRLTAHHDASCIVHSLTRSLAHSLTQITHSSRSLARTHSNHSLKSLTRSLAHSLTRTHTRRASRVHWRTLTLSRTRAPNIAGFATTAAAAAAAVTTVAVCLAADCSAGHPLPPSMGGSSPPKPWELGARSPAAAAAGPSALRAPVYPLGPSPSSSAHAAAADGGRGAGGGGEGAPSAASSAVSGAGYGALAGDRPQVRRAVEQHRHCCVRWCRCPHLSAASVSRVTHCRSACCRLAPPSSRLWS